MTESRTTLLSILCNEPWHFNPRWVQRITFYEDGTGRLVCAHGHQSFLAAPFSWHAHNHDDLMQSISVLTDSSSVEDNSNSLRSFKISMTLHRERLESLVPGGRLISTSPDINPSILHDSAFSEKEYNIDLQAGDFVSPADERKGQTQEEPERFRLRLVFDRSPFPAQREWKVKKRDAANAFKFWEWNTFVAEKIQNGQGGDWAVNTFTQMVGSVNEARRNKEVQERLA